MHRSLRDPLSLPCLLLALLFGAVAPSAATPALQVDLGGTNLTTGAPFSIGNSQVGGTLQLSAPLASPGLPGGGVSGPSFVQGYADDTGTFWVEARTGLEAFAGNADVVWSETYTQQSVADVLEVAITGGHIILEDFGSQSTAVMRGRVEFYVFLYTPGGGTVSAELLHIAEVTGRADNWNLMEQGDLGAHSSFTTASLSGSVEDTAIWTLSGVTVQVPLTQFAVGDDFAVDYVAFVNVQGAGGETAATAFFRDPISLTGGVSVRALGPTPVPEPAWISWIGLALVIGAAGRATRRA